MHDARALAVRLALGVGLCPSLGAQLSLALDSPFPTLGGTVQVEVHGAPGAFFGVQGAVAPAEIALGAIGTLHLDPTKLIALGGGVLDAGGDATLALPIPTGAELSGLVFHLQAGALAGGAILLSNSCTLRLGATAPDGKRNPESIAVTPDGALAFVAHAEDGSVSLIDVASRAVLRDVAVGPAPLGRGLPVHVAIDPEGRHGFVANPWTAELAVLDAHDGSVVARLAVPRSTRSVAFDFNGPEKLVYATNERDRALLRFVEVAPGTFAPLTPIALQGRGPGSLAVHPDGRVAVGHRTDHALEIVDPTQAPGSTTVGFHALGRVPYDVELVGGEAWLATFDVAAPGDGRNELLRVDLGTGAVLGSHLHDRGTDYADVAVSGARLALVAAGSGSVVHADAATLAFAGISDLAPFQPLATPQAAAFAGDELLVVNYFRDSVAVIDLTAPGKPVVAEIAMHLSGAVQVALVTLSQPDDGDWWFRTVQLYNGTPQNPNPVTCASCHPYGAGSDGLQHSVNQAMPMFDAAATAPYGSKGGQPSLLAFLQAAFNAHGKIGGTMPFEADVDMAAYLTGAAAPPRSPFLAEDGALSAQALAGKALFEGAAGCASCHAAPLFIPTGPAKTIPGGVGTGLAPANVPSLRGLWATAPYLHDHAASDLMDVLTTRNPLDQHGLTSGLSAAELEQLVAYLKSL